MKQDHNLDDLIIDDIEPAKSKSKSILSIAALLMILLIIAIVATRLFLGGNDQNATASEESQEVSIGPELKLDTSADSPDADKKELEKLSSLMEESLIDKEADSKKDLSLSASSQEEQIKPETTQIDETAETTSQPVTNEQISEKPVKEENLTSQAATEESVHKTDIPTPETAVAEMKEPLPKKKDSLPKAVETSSAYYVQVGAFTKQPSKQFLSVITKNGFSYKLKKGKLLIGPYNNKAAAKRDLPKIKDKINKGAFIKHL